MDKYRVELSSIAIKDIKRIIRYIKKQLKEPLIAEKYGELFIEEASRLEIFPERHLIVSEDKIKFKNIRRLQVKNYCVFYRINDEKRVVTIERVLYGASNWEEKL